MFKIICSIGGLFLGSGYGFFIGLLVGYIVDRIIDSEKTDNTNHFQNTQNTSTSNRNTRVSTFNYALLELMAAVMKSDGKLLKSELDYVKQFLRKNFGETRGKHLLLNLRDILKRNNSITQTCIELKARATYESRIQILHLLFGIAKSDGNISDKEIKTIAEIAAYLGISQMDFGSIRAMFFAEEKGNEYKILDIDESASNEEIKKAYRKLAIKFHPDKVAHLGDEHEKSAKEKFQKILDAYEKIKKQRGIK